MAKRTSSDLYELDCKSPPELAVRRMAVRRRRGEDPSEATSDVATLMAEWREPWPMATKLDTSGTRRQALQAALGIVEQGNLEPRS